MPRKRASKKRDLKPLLHIFCEGAKTEPNYFRGYIEQYFPGTRFSPIRDTKYNTPVQLVEVAIAEKKNSPEGDCFWVVYDREAKNKYPDELHSMARAKAEAHGINMALSNICFEVWILLHFQKTVAAYNSYLDLRKHSRLTTHIINYEKGVKRTFTPAEIEAARINAKCMNKQTINGANSAWTKPHQWNPYTDVYKLLDAIDAFGKLYH